MDNIFREVRLRSSGRQDKTKCDWGDPTDVAFYITQMRREDRKRVLDDLVPKRICPCCGRQRFMSKSWVVNKDRTEAMCRSCFMRKAKPRDLEETSQLDEVIFPRTVVRCQLDHLALTRSRVRSGLSVKNFALSAGWSTSYQYKLEAGEYKTVTAEVADIILEVLAKEGFYTKDGI